MARRKFIKRVYIKGRETTIPSVKRPSRAFAKKPEAVKMPAAPVLITQPDTRRVLIDSFELPAYYNTTRLVLMVKDPFWIYAYWEIAPDSIAALIDKFGEEIKDARIVLRMYDITTIDFNGWNANHYFDIEVGPSTNNWYINLWYDNVSYCGEIGLRTTAGRFFPLARSNYVHTPRAYYSPRTEQIWMQVTDTAKEAPYIESRIKALVQAKEISAQKHDYPQQKKRIYLTEEDIRRYYAQLTPLLRDIISLRLVKLYGKEARKYPFILEGESEEERRVIYFGLSKFLRRIAIGSSESMFLGASENFPGASEFASEQKRPEHKFFFEIGTELIVYGRTQPDAEVWLGDKKLQLRNDGTFSLRFALPDGKIPLEFKAISCDKNQTRRIATEVERKTNKD